MISAGDTLGNQVLNQQLLEKGIFEVHCADSLAFMKSLPDGFVDCVITDPPYLGFGFSRNPIDYVNAFLPFLAEMLRVTKGETNEVKRVALSQPPGKMELLLKKYPAMNFLKIADAFDDGRGQAANFHIRNALTLDNLVPESWENLPESTHVNARNVNKMAVLVKAMTHPGELILDPFCGSGSTGLAAVLLGRNFIGVELEQERYDDAKQRLEMITGQGFE